MTRLTTIALGLLFAGSLAQAEEPSKAALKWPNWRGPHSNGVADGDKFPTKWSAKENVKWKIKLPGKGASTPVVVGEKVFLTCGVEGRNLVTCLSLQSGETLWKTEVGAETIGKHVKATGANPSIATDGENLYAYFKSTDLACLDLTGKVTWQVNLQEKYGKLIDKDGNDSLWWDLGNSPVLTKDAVVIALMHSGPSYLVAFNKTTGEEVWKTDRNLNAPSEAAQSYTTPALAKEGDREVLITVGADAVTAHDAASGKELWQVNGLNPTQNNYFRSISSPVVSEDIVIAPYARGNSVTAIKLGGKGNVNESHVLWQHAEEGSGSDVPTPIAEGGKVYILHDTKEKKFTCLDVKTGNELWSVVMPKFRTTYSASPIKAGDHFYVTREDGTVFVIKDGKIESENPLDGDMFVATPVLVDGKILLRTVNTLYCIE